MTSYDNPDWSHVTTRISQIFTLINRFSGQRKKMTATDIGNDLNFSNSRLSLVKTLKYVNSRRSKNICSTWQYNIASLLNITYHYEYQIVIQICQFITNKAIIKHDLLRQLLKVETSDFFTTPTSSSSLCQTFNFHDVEMNESIGNDIIFTDSQFTIMETNFSNWCNLKMPILERRRMDWILVIMLQTNYNFVIMKPKFKHADFLDNLYQESGKDNLLTHTGAITEWNNHQWNKYFKSQGWNMCTASYPNALVE